MALPGRSGKENARNYSGTAQKPGDDLHVTRLNCCYSDAKLSHKSDFAGCRILSMSPG